MGAVPGLPRILPDHDAPAVRKRVQSFYGSVAAMLEAWITRSENLNTQRSYRAAVMSFIEFMRIRWPEECWQLLAASVADVRAWREFLDIELDQAPKTLKWIGKFIHISDSRQSSWRTEAAFAWLRHRQIDCTMPFPSPLRPFARTLGFFLDVARPRRGKEPPARA